MAYIKPTKKDKELEAIALGNLGLLPEEVEGFFEFYGDTWNDSNLRKRKFMIINNRKRGKND